MAFFSEALVHTKGRWARQPFIPSRWERRDILEPLAGEVVWDLAAGYRRRYRELYLFLPRKNGKSEIVAGLLLYFLVADGEVGAEVFGLARDKPQAGIIFRVASRMARYSPALRERLRVIPSSGRIVDEQTGSFYMILPGTDPEANLGPDPNAVAIDELLALPSRDLYDVMRTGFGSRAQPMMLLATTAENDPAGWAASERVWSEQVLADPGLDPERLVVMYAAPEDADWTKPSTWRAANPALGDFLEVRVLRAECRKAIGNPPAERAFRQYRLNQPASRAGRAIDLDRWDRCAGPVRAADMPGMLRLRTCYGGLDLASTSDLAAYCLAFPDGHGGADLIWRHFAPAAALRELSRRTAGAADLWVAAGFLTLTEGDVIDYAAITGALNRDRDVAHGSGFSIQAVGFDRWGATDLSSRLVEDGWPLISVGQGFASMAAPTAEYLRLIRAAAIRHGGNPIARWQAGNAVTRSDPAGNLKLDKQRSAEKIDGMVAAVMAVDRMLRAGAPAPDYTAAGF